MRGKGAKKVTDKKKGKDMAKKSTLCAWGGGSLWGYFPVSTLSPARTRLQGWDRKQSMEVIAMVFPEEQEKNL